MECWPNQWREHQKNNTLLTFCTCISTSRKDTTLMQERNVRSQDTRQTTYGIRTLRLAHAFLIWVMAMTDYCIVLFLCLLFLYTSRKCQTRGCESMGCTRKQASNQPAPGPFPAFPPIHMEPGYAYTIDVGPCFVGAGTCVAGLTSTNDTSLSFFQDYDNCPIGIYTTYSYGLPPMEYPPTK